MAKNLIDTSKRYLNFYYKEGEFIDSPKHKFNGRQVGDAEIEFMLKFFKFLIEGSFLNDKTKMWLQSNATSVRVMVESYNEQEMGEDKKLLSGSVSNIIGYDKKKLEKYFPANMIENVLAYPDEYLEIYDDILLKLRRKYMSFEQYNQALAIKLPSDVIERDISEKEWLDLQLLLRTYSKVEMDSIKNGNHQRFNERVIGYFNYLVSNDCKQGVEGKRLETIKEILSLK